MNSVNNRYLVALLILLAPVILFANHFPAPTSNFQPMNIYLIEITYNGVDLMSGDEVAVFDASILAGSKV